MVRHCREGPLRPRRPTGSARLHSPKAPGTPVAARETRPGAIPYVASVHSQLRFDGTYSQTDSGLTATMDSVLTDDGVTHSLVLNLSNPDESYAVVGSFNYTLGDSTYAGDLSLTPTPSATEE